MDGFPRSPLRGLGLVPEDEIEVVSVSGARPSRLLALDTGRLCLVALRQRQPCSRTRRSATASWQVAGRTLMRLVLHIWQPREGRPQYTIAAGGAAGGEDEEADCRHPFEMGLALRWRHH